ncbi:hypothetical protein M9458_054524 [Cirrhinus mrigala]|uniref:Uncharacterized protein n=1 Tax=Cirrhinus mrigala TaxID=683832 RepID=A0ABD0MLZ1_CIRMR
MALGGSGKEAGRKPETATPVSAAGGRRDPEGRGTAAPTPVCDVTEPRPDRPGGGSAAMESSASLITPKRSVAEPSASRHRNPWLEPKFSAILDFVANILLQASARHWAQSGPEQHRKILWSPTVKDDPEKAEISIQLGEGTPKQPLTLNDSSNQRPPEKANDETKKKRKVRQNPSALFNQRHAGESANAVPHYHKLCSRDSHIWGIRRGQHGRSAMDEPRPGRTTFLIMVSPLPGKYDGPGRLSESRQTASPETGRRSGTSFRTGASQARTREAPDYYRRLPAIKRTRSEASGQGLR